MGPPASAERSFMIPLSFVIGALLIAIVAVAGTYLVTSSYDVSHPMISAVTTVSTVSWTQSETSFVTQTMVSLQTVTLGNYGYQYGYGPGCYGGTCYQQNPACSGYLLYGLQAGQTCIAGTLSYQASCVLLYDSFDGNTYVLLGGAAPNPSTNYATVVGYPLSYSSYPCTGVSFQVSYFI